MTAPDTPLPAGFEELEPFARTWARPTENARTAIRLAASAADFAAFDAAMAPRLDALLSLLADCDAHPEDPGRNLALQLACAYAEAAPHHELYAGSPTVPYSFDARRFVPDHGEQIL